MRIAMLYCGNTVVNEFYAVTEGGLRSSHPIMSCEWRESLNVTEVSSH